MIGAGMMGAGIAAQIANAGMPVVLLDIVPNGAPTGTRSPRRRRALLKADPPPSCIGAAARLVTPATSRTISAQVADATGSSRP